MISTRGDKFNIFPGIEAYLNIEYLLRELEQFKDFSLSPKTFRTLTTLIESLRTLLDTHRKLKEEITNLIPEFQNIREILSKRERKSPQIRKELNKWTYKLQSRLNRRKQENDRLKIKWQRPSFMMSCVEIW